MFVGGKKSKSAVTKSGDLDLMGSCVKDVSPGGQSRQLPQGPQALRGPECSGFTVHQHIHINLYQK